MNVLKTTFRKKNGEIREMFFMEVKDLPDSMKQFKGGKKTILPEGMRVVWDVENNGLRMINELELLEEIKVVDNLSFEEIKNKYNLKEI